MSAGVSCQSRSKASAAAKWRGSRRERPIGGVTASPSSESDKTTNSGSSVNSSVSPARGGSEAQEGPGCGDNDGGGRTPDGPEGGAVSGGGPKTQEGPARGVPDAGVGGRTGAGSEREAVVWTVIYILHQYYTGKIEAAALTSAQHKDRKLIGAQTHTKFRN